MGQINSETLDTFKSIHHRIHHLLKEYRCEQTVTDEQLVELLEDIKETSAEMIDGWNDYLGRE